MPEIDIGYEALQLIELVEKSGALLLVAEVPPVVAEIARQLLLQAARVKQLLAGELVEPRASLDPAIPAMRRVERVVQGHPSGIHTTDISRRADTTAAHTLAILRRLRESGRVQRVGRGIYAPAAA